MSERRYCWWYNYKTWCCIKSYWIKKITREPFDPEELSNAQFPACYVQSGDETREPSTMGAVGTGKRQGTIDFVVVGFVKGTTSNIDTLRNQLIEVVEETLDNDITRNGNALNTEIVEVSTDEGEIFLMVVYELW